jgi:hypothetical protein
VLGALTALRTATEQQEQKTEAQWDIGEDIISHC